MPRLNIGDPVYVVWEDSCCCSGWKDDDEVPIVETSLCVSVGWVAKKSERTVTIAPHLGVNDSVSLRQSNGHMMIPISAIRKVQRLNLPKRDEVGR